jgi:hypothetical protein
MLELDEAVFATLEPDEVLTLCNNFAAELKDNPSASSRILQVLELAKGSLAGFFFRVLYSTEVNESDRTLRAIAFGTARMKQLAWFYGQCICIGWFVLLKLFFYAY